MSVSSALVVKISEPDIIFKRICKEKTSELKPPHYLKSVKQMTLYTTHKNVMFVCFVVENSVIRYPAIQTGIKLNVILNSTFYSSNRNLIGFGFIFEVILMLLLCLSASFCPRALPFRLLKHFAIYQDKFCCPE